MQRPRTVLSAAEQRNDLILAAGVFIAGVFSAALSDIGGVYADNQQPLWVAIVYMALIAAPLAVRRRWPIPVGSFIALCYFVAVTLHVPELFIGNLAVFLGIYTIGAWTTNRRAAAISRIAIIVGMFIWLFVVLYIDAVRFGEENDTTAGALGPFVAGVAMQILINVLYFGGAYFFGSRAWNSGQQRLALEQRTQELEQEREVTAAQAVALDRIHIARELHDVVAHHVSAMGVQAGAARMVIDHDAAKSKEMLAGIEDSARQAITELRHLLETLRTPGGVDADAEQGASTLSLDDLPALVELSEQAGVATTFTVVGEPRAVPPLVAVNVYRIAQEALTNIRRHASHGATADVRLRYGDDDVELEVSNTGRIVATPRPGMGQLGMRERAAAAGGTMESGPRPGGGWRVRSRIPLPASTARPASAESPLSTECTVHA